MVSQSLFSLLAFTPIPQSQIDWEAKRLHRIFASDPHTCRPCGRVLRHRASLGLQSAQTGSQPARRPDEWSADSRERLLSGKPASHKWNVASE